MDTVSTTRLPKRRCSGTAARLVALLTLATAIILFCPTSPHAQFYFGKNKVQYTRFDWQVMTTEHFRIYFYKDEKEVARMAAEIGERDYRVLAAKFNHEIRRKTPLIIYSSPSYFSQTNVIPGILPEAVGGFTEFMKGRVVLPFHGSYFDFVHVLQHELVHVFQLAKLDAVTSHMLTQRIANPPLWFTEGQAEFWSKSWDTEADMILKDMVISGRLLSIDNFWQVEGSFFMYKLGESVCKFIDSTYGPEKIVQLYNNWPKGRSFEEIVRITLGDDLTQDGGGPHPSVQTIGHRATLDDIFKLDLLFQTDFARPATAVSLFESLQAVLVPLAHPGMHAGAMDAEQLRDLRRRFFIEA